MIFTLLIIVAVPALITILRAREINHNVFFSAGFLYYWVLPFVVGYFPLAGTSSNAAYQTWASIFADLPRHRVVIFVASIAIYYGCFRFGDQLAKIGLVTPRKIVRVSPKLNFISVIYAFFFVVALVYVYQLRWAIGTEYGKTSADLVQKGTLTAISLMLFGMALLKTVNEHKATFWATINNRWMFGYLIIAVALLGMGQRLYFVTSLLLLVSYRSIFFKKFTGTELLIFVLGVAAFGGLVGVVRLGATATFGRLLLNLAFEPVFTSFSLVSFLGMNHIPWLEWPRFLGGDFLNLVPSILMKNKLEVLPNPATDGFPFIAPLGALNSWVSFIVNFGLVGTAFAMGAMGYFLRWLFIHSKWPILRTQYLLCSSFMTFTFFRDPFSVSLVKNLFEFSLMMPLFYACMSGLIALSARVPGPPQGSAGVGQP